jgi:hypothetical protein
MQSPKIQAARRFHRNQERGHARRVAQAEISDKVIAEVLLAIGPREATVAHESVGMPMNEVTVHAELATSRGLQRVNSPAVNVAGKEIVKGVQTIVASGAAAVRMPLREAHDRAVIVVVRVSGDLAAMMTAEVVVSLIGPRGASEIPTKEVGRVAHEVLAQSHARTAIEETEAEVLVVMARERAVALVAVASGTLQADRLAEPVPRSLLDVDQGLRQIRVTSVDKQI